MAHEEIVAKLKARQLEAEIGNMTDNVALCQLIDALMEIDEDLELQLSSRNAELKQFQITCKARGPAGREAYDEQEAEVCMWKASIMPLKNRVVSHLRKARLKLEALNLQLEKPIVERVEALEAQMAQVQQQLGSTDEQS